MKSKIQSNEVQISRIINTVIEPGCGFVGFIITYPDGRIENTVIDYQSDNYELIYSELLQLYNRVLSRYGMKKR